MTGATIHLDEFVLPGSSASDGERVALAFHREIGRLFEADRAAGIGWDNSLVSVELDLDPALRGEALGHAIAREVRLRARRDPSGGQSRIGGRS